MRNEFAAHLMGHMMVNKDIYLLLGDVGYGIFDIHRAHYPNRVINCGAAEFSMLAVAVGLAMEGKTVFVYTITPFLLWRGAEVIRNYIHHEGIPVRLVGSGRDMDYKHDGFSHVCPEDVDLFSKIFYNIKTYRPETKEDISVMVKEMVFWNMPSYLNLKRGS